MVRAKATCNHCGDVIDVATVCRRCLQQLVTQCVACHNETSHGVLADPQASTCLVGTFEVTFIGSLEYHDRRVDELNRYR